MSLAIGIFGSTFADLIWFKDTDGEDSPNDVILISDDETVQADQDEGEDEGEAGGEAGRDDEQAEIESENN